MLFILISQASFSLRRVGFLDVTLLIREIGIISDFIAFFAISALAAALALQAGQSQMSPHSAQWPPSGRTVSTLLTASFFKISFASSLLTLHSWQGQLTLSQSSPHVKHLFGRPTLLRMVPTESYEPCCCIQELEAISALPAALKISALAAALALQAGQSQSSPQVSQWPPSGRLSVFISFAPTKESKILALAAALALQAGQSQSSPQEAQ
jgi:hypothetical protein